MALRRAIGAVKDQTSISLAKVNNYSDSLSELDIAIVKATRHDEYPAEERHVREILGLMHYSRHFVSACVGTIARRLNKTRNWVVALKSLMLIQRLLAEGEAAYEQEIFFATRRGTRLLNLSDFRDTTGRNYAWDYSAFVRTYALYLDERLECRMQGRRKSNEAHDHHYGCEDEACGGEGAEEKAAPAAKELNVERLISNIQTLQQLLERFLATRPTGAAKSNRLTLVALYPVVKESFRIYYDITYMLGILIRMFVALDVSEAVKIHDIFYRSSKQFDELDSYYTWCKDAGITRSSNYPEIEPITPVQLQKMDSFIRRKSSQPITLDLSITVQPKEVEEENVEAIKALPAPEENPNEEEENQEVQEEEKKPETPRQHEGDLLNLWDEPMTSEQHGDQFSLVLFNGPGPGPSPLSGSVWEAFNSTDCDWETELVQSTSYLPHQRTEMGGGLDMLLLDGLYMHGNGSAPSLAQGSTSSVAFGSAGNPPAPTLALPAPPIEVDGSASGQTMIVQIDPFGPSTAVPPPSYVQMSELERKQQLMVEEQIMWQQYERNGMQGHIMVPQGQYMGIYNPQLQVQNNYPNGYGYN